MVKGKMGECKNCGKETILGFLIVNGGICNTCKTIPKKEVVIKEEELIVCVDKGIKEGDSSSMQLTINLNLPLYTASYLNNKLKKNLNSIKNQKICIEYQGRYILHEDIIKQFKDSIT